MDNLTVHPVILFMLLAALVGIITQGEAVPSGGGEFRPVEAPMYRVVGGGGGEGRRQLTPFELCLECKCCSSATTCATMPCCFGIDCQLPNKPFGVCAFVPKTCNCLSCSV